MRKLILLILIALTILLGCTQSTSKSKEIDIFVGTQGLTADFSKTAPPPRVFEDSSFPI